MTDTADFFRSRLDQMIDLSHPLSVLACRMPWQEVEASVAHLFAKKVRAGRSCSTVAGRKSMISLETGLKAQTTKQVWQGLKGSAGSTPRLRTATSGPSSCQSGR